MAGNLSKESLSRSNFFAKTRFLSNILRQDGSCECALHRMFQHTFRGCENNNLILSETPLGVSKSNLYALEKITCTH